jgi:hypothetical protein
MSDNPFGSVPGDESPLDHVVDDVEAREQSAKWAYEQLAEGRTPEEVEAALVASGWPPSDAATMAEEARRQTRHLRGVITRDDVARVSEARYRRAMADPGGVGSRRRIDINPLPDYPVPAAPDATPDQQWAEWTRAALSAGRPPTDVTADLVARGWPADAAARLVAAVAGPQPGYAPPPTPRERAFHWKRVRHRAILAVVGAGLTMLGVTVASAAWSDSRGFLPTTYFVAGMLLLSGLVVLVAAIFPPVGRR